ncbi:MAG: hypothetical protein DMG13_32550, partial [Acidobacteria bacterium]
MMVRATAVGENSRLTATTVLNNPAWVATDMDDYPPGATMYISGGGFLAHEMVQLQVLHVGSVYGEHVDSEASNGGDGHDTWTVYADGNGNLLDATWYVCLDDCSGALLELTATGLTSGLTAKTRFTDLAFVLFENGIRTIKRDAFTWGSSVYARITQARNDTCYRVEWIDPGGAVATHDLPGTSGLNGNADRDDSFSVSPTGPSGIWMSRMSAYANGNFDCTGSPSLQATLTFDVARAVVIGAGTTGTDSVGGDSDVNQNQANTIQGGGTAVTLSVASASGSKNKRTFLRFDLTGSGISGTVTNAKLRLLMTSSPNNSRTHNAHRVTASWAENTITWNNQPGVAASPTDAQSTGSANNTLLRWTLTADVNGFVNGSLINNGWRIGDSVENSSGLNDAATYRSTEANSSTDKTQGPVLLADYSICGNGALEAGEQCDDGNTHDGDCCSSTCQYESSATVCRPSVGPCDVAETCTGTSATCPANGFASSATVCRAAAGECDLAESCTGSSASCPADVFKPAATVCRPGSGDVCDPDETCTGTGASCPADVVKPSSFECRTSAGVCDTAESCTGVATQACPADVFKPAVTVCRPGSGDVCDPDETCTGTGA